MVELRVSSEIYNFYGKFDRRISYLRGDSGVGKTSMIDLVRLSDPDVAKVECNKKVTIVDNIDSNEEILTKTGTLFLMDDLLISEMSSWFTPDIPKALVKNDSYLLIINRADIPIHFDNNVEFSLKSIYYLKILGKDHICVPFVMADEFPKFTDKTVSECDKFIVEDNYGMHSLLKAYVKGKIYSTKGKEGVISRLINLLDGSKGISTVVLFADTASFGQYIEEILFISDVYNATIVLDKDYECFEYLLLSSNMFNDVFKFDENKANSYTSWEKYFESELASISSKKYYRYVHGSELRTCFLDKCDRACMSDFIKQKCDKYSKADKLIMLLKGTEFSYILDFRRKSADDNS